MFLEEPSQRSAIQGQGSHRPLKRRHPSLSELPFFTPAATSFNPPPYSGSGERKPCVKLPLFSNSLSLSKPMHSLPALDPLPSDPHVLFIRPPFTSFPNSAHYPDGLSYSVMAANPDWFLDPSDFICSNASNQAAIAYPPQLEPPRGWCPARKKTSKAPSFDGWPDGEEPRLRCTFCRRTYAGVNAKSMWRRHVYEKHKIAMSNRRDGSDRYRSGRGTCRKTKFSDKENELDGTSCGRKPCDAIKVCDVKDSTGSYPIPSMMLKKSWHSPTTNSSDPKGNPTSTYRKSGIEQGTMGPSSPVDPAGNRSVLEDTPVQPLLSAEVSDSMESANPIVPPSPYNPLRTPSFRHSTPQLPSDQPWRFPSPSHPLHSRNREFCLNTLARGGDSPVHQGLSSINHNKAFLNLFRSPRNAEDKRFYSYNLPDSKFNYSPTVLLETSRSLFPSNHSSTLPVQDPILPRSINEPSEFSHDDPFTGPKKPSQDIEAPQSWEVSTLSTSSTRSGAISLAGDDPFGRLYRQWFDSSASQHRTGCSRNISPETESPVLRNDHESQCHDISAQRANFRDQFRVEGQEHNRCSSLLSESDVVDALHSSMENVGETRRIVDSGALSDDLVVSDFENNHRYGQKPKKVRKF